MLKLLLPLITVLGVLGAYAAGDGDREPSAVNVQEGKVVYAPVPFAVNMRDEVKIQRDDQNSTRHGQAK